MCRLTTRDVRSEHPLNHVYFVSVDFTRDRIFEKLTETGYDPAKKTLFLWEGVTFYLSETEVRKIMRSVSAQAFKDSILLADIYAIRMLNIGKSAAGKYVMGYTEEEFGFGLDLTEAWETLCQSLSGVSLWTWATLFLWAVIKGKDLSWWLPKLPTKGSLACC